MNPERELRIFLSSTFSDLHPEREALTAIAIPALEDLAANHGVYLNFIDLRWGLEAIDSIDDELILACFGAIDSCRPFFVGIVGSCYGTIVNKPGERVTKVFEWTQARDRWSITELEMEYGALQQPSENALFYLRADIDDDENVRHLKERIRKSGVSITDGYQSIDQFIEYFVADMTTLIIRNSLSSSDQWFRLPPLLGVDTVVLPDRLAQLRNTLEAGYQRIAILGPRGCGKTSLINILVSHFSKSELLIYWDPFNQLTSSWEILGTLIDQAEKLKLLIEAPSIGIRKLPCHLADLIFNFIPNQEVILIIDPIDFVVSEDGIDWLLTDLPPQVRLVVTASSTPPLSPIPIQLKRAGFHCIELDWLSEVDQRAVITGLLAQRGRVLNPSLLERFLRSKAASSVSYLVTAVNYLCTFASHENLEEHLGKIESMMSPKEIAMLGFNQLVHFHSEGKAIAAAIHVVCTIKRGIHIDDLEFFLVHCIFPDKRIFWPRVCIGLLRYVHQMNNQFLIPRPEFSSSCAFTSLDTEFKIKEKLLEFLPSRVIAENGTRRDYLDFLISGLVNTCRTKEAIDLLCSGPLCKLEREAWLSSGQFLFLEREHLEELMPQNFVSAELASRVAILLFQLGLNNSALATKAIALNLYDHCGDELEAAWGKSQLAMWMMTKPEELAVHNHSLFILEKTGSSRTSDVLLASASVLRYMGCFVEALTRIEAAERASQSPVTCAYAAAERAFIYLELGFSEEALRSANSAIGQCSIAKSNKISVLALRCRGAILAELGDVKKARMDFLLAQGLAMRSGNIMTMMALSEHTDTLTCEDISFNPTINFDTDSIIEIERKLFGLDAHRDWGEFFKPIKNLKGA